MVKNVALKAILFIIILWTANLAYGFVHEAAHALVVKTLGGQVYALYVNPLGTDAYTVHSFMSIPTEEVMVELAGMAVTTALAFFTLFADYTPLPVFIALRTAIYALNYAPGTDIFAVRQVLGNVSLMFSAALVVLNLACAAIAITALIKGSSLREPVLKRFLHL